MKQNFKSLSSTKFRISVAFLILFSSMILNAQKQIDFSGKWEYDKVRSDKNRDSDFEGKIIIEIKQNPSEIIFINTISVGAKSITTEPDSYRLDGTVTEDHSGSDPAKKFVKWSSDRRFLTTNYVMTATIDGVAQDFLQANTCSLSEDGKTLFIVEFRKSKLNGEETIKKIYTKS